MDTELLKTFLELSRTRHFRRAAENLFISQSAVSARIHQLEEQLGVPLFTRERNNIQLTAAGHKLLKFADTIIGVWKRAQLEVAVVEEERSALSVGGVAGLWDDYLQQWLKRVSSELPQLVLSIEAHNAGEILRGVCDRTLDIGFSFEAPRIADLSVTELPGISLIMVSSTAHQKLAEALQDAYIFVDWGTSFASAHANMFPQHQPPSMRVNLGRIACDFILRNGGAAYLAEGAVAADLAAGRLHRVEGAPPVLRAVYALHRTDSERRVLIEGLLAIAGANMQAG